MDSPLVSDFVVFGECLKKDIFVFVSESESVARDGVGYRCWIGGFWAFGFLSPESWFVEACDGLEVQGSPSLPNVI